MAGCLGQLHQPGTPSRAELLVEDDSALWIGLVVAAVVVVVVVGVGVGGRGGG